MSDTLLESTVVTFKSTNNLEEAKALLDSIQTNTIACDFEAASRYTEQEKEQFKQQLETAPRLEKHLLKQKIDSNGLSHPSLSQLTHLSLAYSETEAFVFIFDNKELQDYALNWLVTTDKKQIWHNLCFDGKHIFYNTGKLPKNYEDSQILALSLIHI